MWLKMYDAYKKDSIKNNKLFFNATAIVIVTADSAVNGALCYVAYLARLFNYCFKIIPYML